MLLFVFTGPASTEIYPLSLHDALPILVAAPYGGDDSPLGTIGVIGPSRMNYSRVISLVDFTAERSEEHTSELQSHSDLVCRLLLEKKKNIPSYFQDTTSVQHIQIS